MPLAPGFFALPCTILFYPFVFAVITILWQTAKKNKYMTAAEALNTYLSGLRAPALIAVVKDTMIYIVVIAAILLIPFKLGGYSPVFEAAAAAFKAKGSGILLTPSQFAPYVSLALGSALALFMYPHALTGILASASANTIRKNAMLLPAYSMVLALVTLMGLMGHSAGLKLSNNNDVVPLLIKTLFPGWFADCKPYPP